MRYILFFFLSLNVWATTYIGYGTGKTSQEAKQNAFKDISGQISIKIGSSTTRSKSSIDGKYNQNTSMQSIQQTNATLNGYTVLETSFKQGRYSIKISYENIPSLDKFANKFSFTKKQIVKAIKKDFGKSLGVELIRKDKKWYIKYKNIMQVLDEKDFKRFFVTKLYDALSLNINKRNNILYEDDEFYFKVKSTQEGYASILTVYENGTVSALVKNILIAKNKNENIPDKEFEAIPQAGLIEKGKETFDMYVLVVSKSKLIFDSFASANDELISDERYKNFDELIDFLEDKTYTTLKVVTKPR